MSTEKLTRAQRRAMKQLAAAVDRATAADRVFFERFPHRQHRVRHAHSAEIAQEAIIHGEALAPLPGFRIFTIVKNLCSGARLRVLLQAEENTETDMDEAAARELFATIESDETRRMEAEMRAIACRENAA